MRKQTLATFPVWAVYWTSVLGTLFRFCHLNPSVESKSNVEKTYRHVSPAIIVLLYLFTFI